MASVYGSGGECDVISQWTYSYPDPIRIGLATDELLAMAAGAKHDQEVMKMTQIIWYRSQTAPPPKSDKDAVPYKARREKEIPDAQFITIAPMHLREAFWTKIARPIKVDIRDSAGHLAEGSGYYAAVGGKCAFTLAIAKNDAFGVWTVAVREGASDKRCLSTFRVNRPGDWPPKKGPVDEKLTNPEQPKG